MWPAVFNAANEVAVAAFLERRLPFSGIAEVVEACLQGLPAEPAEELEVVFAADRRARELARQRVASGPGAA